MPATLIGNVGIWGIESDELDQGLIIEDIEDTSKKKSNYLMNKSGCRSGRADYDESIEVAVKGKSTATAGFDQKLSDDLVLSNAITSAHLQADDEGRLLVDEVKRKREIEGWHDFNVTAEFLPFFPAAPGP